MYFEWEMMAQIGYAKDLAVLPHSQAPVVSCGPRSTSKQGLSPFEVLSSLSPALSSISVEEKDRLSVL